MIESADDYAEIGPGRLGAITQRLRSAGVEDVVIVGAVDKATVLDPSGFDEVGLGVVRRLTDASDRALLGAVLDVFVSEGFVVGDQRSFLPGLLVPEGLLAGEPLSRSEQRDADVALEAARTLAKAGVGQTVVVRQGITAAVEAMEGTDATIRRAASLAGVGVIVAKAAHAQHDFRCDVPTIGPGTLSVLRDCAARGLILEAGRAFVVDREAFLDHADACGLTVIGCP